MKKIAGVVVVLIFAYMLYFSFSMNQPSPRDSGPAGVILAPPPSFYMVDMDNHDADLLPTEAAQALVKIRQANPEKGQIGLSYQLNGKKAFFLADFLEDKLQQTVANTYGTAVQTTWKGEVEKRLSWARTKGSFDVPGLTEPQSRNLYH